MTESFCSAPPDKKPSRLPNALFVRSVDHFASSTLGSWTWIMNTNSANAPNTKRIRCGSPGRGAPRAGSSARLGFLFERRAGRRERFAGGAGEQDRAELQAGRQRRAVAGPAEDLHAVGEVLEQALLLERGRSHFDGRIPRGELVEIDDRERGAEVPDVAGLLRVAALVRKATRPGRLSAFERGTLTAARTHGLTLAAFAAGLDHARTVTATDAG